MELPKLGEQWEGRGRRSLPEHPGQISQQNFQEEELSPRGTGGKQKDVTKQAEPRGGVRSEPVLWLICTEKSVFPIPSLNNSVAGAD